MIRLTLLLLAGIVATLSIAGRDMPSPAGAEAVAVTRTETDLPGATPGRLALDDEAGAIQRALNDAQATQPASAPETAIVQQASVAGPEETGRLQAIVNAERVNLRAGPSTANSVVDQAVRNQPVEVIETQDDWAKIRVSDSGLEAWIFGRFLTPQG